MSNTYAPPAEATATSEALLLALSAREALVTEQDLDRAAAATERAARRAEQLIRAGYDRASLAGTLAKLRDAAVRQIIEANAAIKAARRAGRDDEHIQGLRDKLTADLAAKFDTAVIEAAYSHVESQREPDRQADETWARGVGHSLSTQLVSDSSLELAPAVEEHLGTELRKLWMSRADAKVRGSHRKLHGSTAPLDKPFWKELGTGKELSYPGDPSAPIEQTINCRCWLWFVTKDQAAAAEDTFKLPDSEFDLVAASGHAHGSIWDLDFAIIAAAYDSALGLVAATTDFEERQHKRDTGGKFAKKGFDYAAWKKRGGWDYVLDYFNRQNKGGGGKGGGKGGGGGRRVGGAGGGSDRAGNAGREDSEKEAMRVRKEAMRTQRRDNREKLLAQRRKNDAARRGKRLTEDEALDEVRYEVEEVERELRAKQREIEQSQRDIERSRAYIRDMRLRGELPEIIEAERQRLGGLEKDHATLVKEADNLIAQSRKLGTPDNIRRLRDRVRYSQRTEDDAVRSSREEYDARIRIAQQKADDELRRQQEAMRARHKAS